MRAGPDRHQPLVLALWLALTAGLIEGVIRLVQSIGFGKVIGVSPHIIWTAPVANLVLFGVPALLLVLAGRLLPAAKRDRVTSFVLLSLAVASLLLLYQSMHKAVILFLAAAIGWKLSDLLRRSSSFSRLARRSIPVLALAAAAGGFAIAGYRKYEERKALGAAPAGERLNVLLIILDTVRGENLSLYGYDRPTTPFLEKFARGGVRFDQAMSTAPWTLPSHGSIFTGRLPVQLKAQWRTPLAPEFPVIAETFSQAGYRTGGFVANTAYATREHGLARGFGHYEDYLLSPAGILTSSRMGHLLIDAEPVRQAFNYWNIAGRKDSWTVNRQFVDWMEERSDRPFFAFLNYFDAHQPYLPSEPFRSRFVERSDRPYEPRPESASFEQMTPEDLRTLLQHYDGGIAMQDEALSQLMDHLAASGVLDRTVVIITSDHGEQFGEHRRMSHGNSLYRQLLQVPLLVRLPASAPAGLVVRQPVSLVDLSRTMLGMAGVADSSRYPGRSLARFWQASGDTTPEPVVAVMYGPRGSAWSFMDDGYHFVKWFGQTPELYRMDDPRETEDLAKRPDMQDRLNRFTSLGTEYSRTLSDQGRTTQ